jgi:hypothetical protein
MLVSSTIFCQHFEKCCNIFKNVGQHFPPFFKVLPTFFRMLQHFFRNVCFVNYILLTFGKMLQQFSLKCGKQQFPPSLTSSRRRHGVRGTVHARGPQARRMARTAGNEIRGLGRGTRERGGGSGAGRGADSRRPVGHGGTEEAARATATAWEVQPATRGWRGVAAEVPTSSGAARSRVAAIGSGEEEEGCETYRLKDVGLRWDVTELYSSLRNFL